MGDPGRVTAMDRDPAGPIREALGLLGVRRLVLSVHAPSFPSDPSEDTGHGSPYSRGAERFVEFVARLGFNGLMLGPQGSVSPDFPSPYDSTLFSRSPLGIALGTLDELAPELLPPSLARLAADELAEAVVRLDQAGAARRTRVDYRAVHTLQTRLLDRLFRTSPVAAQLRKGSTTPGSTTPGSTTPGSTTPGSPEAAFLTHLAGFVRREAGWLDRDALYAVCAEEHGSRDWRRWHTSDGSPHPDQRLFADDGTGADPARTARRSELRTSGAEVIARYGFIQYLAFAQHERLRARLGPLGLRLYGDLQVGVSHQDLWSYRDRFLDDYLMGAPPSRTNPAGQPWGYPVLDPQKYRRPSPSLGGDGEGASHGPRSEGGVGPALAFLRARIELMFRLYDAVRIDHPHGLVCPWVYRADDPDPFHAVQHGARLFASPDLDDHPALCGWSIAHSDQLDRSVPRHADGWVRTLTPAQVARYAVMVDELVQFAASRARDFTGADAALVCEVLSTLPYPVKRVLDRHGLGRFRVTQKVDLADPKDPYRSENAKAADWIMVGTHDTRPLALVADEWMASGTGRGHAAYLAARLASACGGAAGRSRDRLAEVIGRSPAHLIQAKFAELFASRAQNVLVFFSDLFGLRAIYNRPGVISDENWSLRVPPDYPEVYREHKAAGAALHLPLALALALQAKGAKHEAARALVRHLGAVARREGGRAAAELLDAAGPRAP